MKYGARGGATDIVLAWSSAHVTVRAYTILGRRKKMNAMTACNILKWFVDGCIAVNPGLCMICLFSCDALYPRDTTIHSPRWNPPGLWIDGLATSGKILYKVDKAYHVINL